MTTTWYPRAVEVLARHLAEEYYDDDEWSNLPERKHEYYRYKAREALAAIGLDPAFPGPVRDEAGQVARVEAEKLPTVGRSVTLIIDKYSSRCSACNGNADPNERQHTHGGPGDMYREGSGLDDTNGCGATFTERYYVSDGRTEAVA